MGLWAEMKVGTVKPVDRPTSSGSNLEPQPGDLDPTAGKELICRTLYQISDLWNLIENTGGSIAWEWILRGSPHGVRIRKAEDRVNAIGSKGNQEALESVCNAWVNEWREGIEAWKRRNHATETGVPLRHRVRQ